MSEEAAPERGATARRRVRGSETGRCGLAEGAHEAAPVGSLLFHSRRARRAADRAGGGRRRRRRGVSGCVSGAQPGRSCRRAAVGAGRAPWRLPDKVEVLFESNRARRARANRTALWRCRCALTVRAQPRTVGGSERARPRLGSRCSDGARRLCKAPATPAVLALQRRTCAPAACVRALCLSRGWRVGGDDAPSPHLPLHFRRYLCH